VSGIGERSIRTGRSPSLSAWGVEPVAPRPSAVVALYARAMRSVLRASDARALRAVSRYLHQLGVNLLRSRALRCEPTVRLACAHLEIARALREHLEAQDGSVWNPAPMPQSAFHVDA
jgi:hypothetical protein